MTGRIYAARRSALRTTLAAARPDFAVLLMGHGEAPRNYAANPYRFRQDSHVLYYTGLAVPGLALLMLPDGRDLLFGPPPHPDDIIWCGPTPPLAERAATAGLDDSAPMTALGEHLSRLAGVTVHYPPPYRQDTAAALAEVLGRSLNEVTAGYSKRLVSAIARQRARKTAEEIREIEDALTVTAAMFQAVYRTIAPGRRESEVAGAMQGVALAHDRDQSFQPIVTVQGEILHNGGYGNIMREGDLLVVDCGAESPRYYASDITRTLPVSGRFNDVQRAVYGIVLAAQAAVIETARPGVTNRELHLSAARVMAEGLSAMGLIRGDLDAAVQAGAHALFFPHGLGHMLGLDVHDMEDLGDVVGYGEDGKRDDQFGLSALRLARKLEPGFVVTVEPGIYFNPALIDRWQAENRLTDFIDYAAVSRLKGFGGVRIEDDLLITEDGARVLGPPIPKQMDAVEAALTNGGWTP